MAIISEDDGYLTVLNLFGAETADAQQRLLTEMRGIINAADYPGWISSTLLSGVDEPGTANYIQWRSVADLEERYSRDYFRHRTVPLFNEISTSISLLKTEVAFTRRQESLPRIEVTPKRDDYTVIVVMGVKPEDQQELVDLFAQPDEWLTTVPGYRSNTILRGLDGTFVVNLAQWDSKEHYDEFHHLPEAERPEYVRRMRERAGALLTSREANTYRVVHTRSAADRHPVTSE